MRKERDSRRFLVNKKGWLLLIIFGTSYNVITSVVSRDFIKKRHPTSKKTCQMAFSVVIIIMVV